MTATLERLAPLVGAYPEECVTAASRDDLPHTLVVLDEFDPDFPDDAFRVVHHPTCPAQLDDDGTGGAKMVFYCHVGIHEAAGPSVYFQHGGDRSVNDGRDVVSAGQHLIEAWSGRKGTPWEEIDYDGGLRVVDER